jgi:O-antigen/teichoic acid export membrane protein
MSNRQSYRQIFKATSLFGGVQVVNVLTGILRSKFLAVFLGPAGMGVSSLLVASVTLIVTISSLGLNFSAVRDLSQAHENEDQDNLAIIITVFKRWLWISCALGVILLISLSTIISKIAFDSSKYTMSLVVLSVMLVFTLLTNGNVALLQGMRRLTFAAKSTVIGSIIALILSIPCYYFYGIDGIVPALVVSSFVTYVVSHYFTRSVLPKPAIVRTMATVNIGNSMVKLGLVMMLGQIFGSLVVYAINLFIRHHGGIVDVGLYQAGIMITSQSIGLVFSAMSMDFFPRLSVVAHDLKKSSEMVNQQAIITVLIACPLLICLIVFAPLVIKLLLAKDFSSITFFVRWIAFGTIFTAPGVVLGYVALAKGAKRVYFLYCTFYNSLLSIAFYLGGYVWNGLDGMAIGICSFQIIYLIFLSVKFYSLYSFLFSKQFMLLYLKLIGMSALTLFITFYFGMISTYCIGGCILVYSIFFTWKKLDQLIGINIHIKEKISNFKKK